VTENNGRLIFETTKTGEERTVPLPPFLAGASGNSVRVIVGTDPGTHWVYDPSTRPWEDVPSVTFIDNIHLGFDAEEVADIQCDSGAPFSVTLNSAGIHKRPSERDRPTRARLHLGVPEFHRRKSDAHRSI
jgi:hypothetical protein